MKIDKKNIKLWSQIGPRATLGLFAMDLAKNYNDLVIVTADVSTSAGLDRFKKKFPNQYIDVGISEQNMIGIAAGLASENLKVITTTFSPFQVLRCCEQIKVNLGYMKNNITMVGLASGIVLGNLGYTHCSIEDIGVLRSIPNITIVSPADSFETAKALEASVRHHQSVYIRLTGSSNTPIIYNDDYDFVLGKSIKLKKGNDILIIANGTILYEAINVHKELENQGYSVELVNMHTIKPIDNDIIIEASKKFSHIFTIEEHNIIGGLGSAVSENLIENKFEGTFKRFGINDHYTKSGSYNFLKIKHGIDSKSIICEIKKYLRS